MRFSSAKSIELSWVDSQVCYERAVDGTVAVEEKGQGGEVEEKGQGGEVEEKVPVLHGLPATKVL